MLPQHFIKDPGHINMVNCWNINYLARFLFFKNLASSEKNGSYGVVRYVCP